MNHEGFVRDRGTETAAVILIHGILSTPRHFDWLIPHIPEKFAVYSLLLAGHGGTVEDFTKATMKKWKAQVEECISRQKKKGRAVVLAGHSLGALLALDAAQSYPCVCALYLLNPPLCPFVKPVMVKRSLRFAFGKLDRSDVRELRCYEDLSVALEPKLWKYLGWIPNFISLLRLASQCKKLPGKLKIPTYAALGQLDELVSIRSAKWLEGESHIRLQILPEGGHFGYTEQEQQKLLEGFSHLLTEA